MNADLIMILLFKIVIWGLVFYVVWWGLNKIGLPEPFNKIAIVVLVILAVYVALMFLMPMARL